MQYEDELLFAKNLAVAAGAIATQYYKTDLEFVTKGDKSPVTVADETINELVIEAVKRDHPEHGVLGEEQSWQPDRPLIWVCDPIDGTVSYSMGEPESMFSLSLVENGKPVLAVVSDLTNGDMFWARTGTGAFMNGKSMHVSHRNLSEAWLAFPTNLKALINSQAIYLPLTEQAYQTNMIHSSVFKGMLIAQGLCDGSVWPGSVQPWDAAAVKLIVEEAGGRMTDLKGREHRFDAQLTGGLIVSNSVIHDELMDICAASAI